MTPDRPDTEDTPPAHPRRASSERNVVDEVRAAPELEGRKGWTVEGTGTWAAVALTLFGLLVVGGIWVGGVQRDVTELQTWRTAHLTEDSKREDRTRALELAQVQSAGEVASINSQLGDIKDALRRIENTLNPEQPGRRQPRSRPIGAPMRVTNEH